MNWPMQIVGDRNGYTATPYMPGPSLAGLQFGRQAGFDLGSAINNAYNGATMRAIGQQYAANPVIMQNQRSNMLQNTLPQILSALGGSMGSLGQGGVNTDYGASVRGPKPTDTAKYNTGLNSLLSAFA